MGAAQGKLVGFAVVDGGGNCLRGQPLGAGPGDAQRRPRNDV